MSDRLNTFYKYAGINGFKPDNSLSPQWNDKNNCRHINKHKNNSCTWQEYSFRVEN